MLHEAQRRVLAHLSEPRSIPNLTRVLRDDEFSPFDATDPFEASRADVEEVLAREVTNGNAVALGSHSEAKSLLRAVAEDKGAIDIPKVKADRLSVRLESGRDSRLDTGPLFVLSKQGLEALQA